MASSSSSRMAAKAEEIRRVLSEPTVDLWKLRELALTEGGLVNDSLRKLAWPKLVGVHPTDSASFPSGPVSVGSDLSSGIPPSLDAQQIERDVSRVTWHLLTGNQRSRNFQMKNKHRKRIQQLLKKKQSRLGDFLNLVLVWSYREKDDEGAEVDSGEKDEGNHVVEIVGKGGDCDFITTVTEEGEEESRLRYYQGYHDVASIVLSALGGASSPLPPTTPAGDMDHSPPTASQLVDVASSMGLTLASQVLLRLSRSHLRDALRSNFLKLQSALRLIVLPLLGAFDGELHSHLKDCDMEPYFCLSWIITWFAHDVRDTALVKRLYDFFIVSHPLMSVYVSVAMMIHPLNRIEVMGADCDFACVHHALADLPKNSSNVGWKYLPGDKHDGGAGYVTGEEEDEDARSYDASLQDQSLDEEDDGSMLSLGGLGGAGGKARVPFQELIDLSISLMHKIPPRNLVNLARRYYAEVTLKPLMAQASTIALLQPPPYWGIISHADSDWVLKQKLRQEYGLTKLNRHQRKNRLKQQEFRTTEAPEKRKRPPSVRASIASGTGPDGLEEQRVLRKKRRMLVRTVAVVVISVFVALAKDYFSPEPTAAVARSSRLQQSQQRQQVTNKEVFTDDGVAGSLLTEDDGPDTVIVGKADDDKSLTDVATMQEEGEMVQLHMTEKSQKKSLATLEDGDNEKSITPPRKKQINDVCGNDEAATVCDFFSVDVQPSAPPPVEKQSSSSAEEATAPVHSKNPAASKGGENDNIINAHQKETTCDVLANDEASAVDGLFLNAMKSSVSPIVERQKSSVDRQGVLARNSIAQQKEPISDMLANDEQSSDDKQEVLVRHSILAAKETLTTINQTLDVHLDQLEQRFDSLLMKLMHRSKAAWSKIAPVIMNALRIGWHRIIIKVGWLNRIAAPVVKEELALELEGASLEWAEHAMKTWKKQEVMLINRGKLIAKLAKAGKESLSIRL